MKQLINLVPMIIIAIHLMEAIAGIGIALIASEEELLLIAL